MNKKMLLILGLLFFAFMTGYVLADDVINNYGTHLSRNEDEGYLYPTVETDDMNLSGNKLLEANLSDYAGNNIVWDGVNMEFDASGGGIGGNPFDQDLNTTDDVIFNSVSGDGSGLSGVLHNWSDGDPFWNATDTEAELEAHIIDVSDIFTDNDGALNDDDLSDNTSTQLSDTADLLYETELDSESELEGQLTDVSDVYTDNDFTDNSSNWDTAFGWGDHGIVGYLTSTFWNDSGTTLFPSTDGRDVQVNGTIHCNDGNVSNNLTVRGNLTLPLESKLFFGSNNDAYMYREEDGDMWIYGTGATGGDALDINSWQAVAFDTIGQFTVLSNGVLGLRGYGGDSIIYFGASGIYFGNADNDVFGFNNNKNDADLWYKGVTDDNLFYIDASTDRVGIGTSSPDQKLDVVGGANFSSDVNVSGDLTVAGDVAGANLNIANWDTAYTERGSQIAGSNLTWDGSELDVDWTDFAPSGWNPFDQLLNTFNKVTFNQVNLTNDASCRLYNDSGVFYINNSGVDKDIIFSVNDGNVQKEFMKIDSSIPGLSLTAGDWGASISTPLLKISGTDTSDATALVMQFDVINQGSGYDYIAYGTATLANPTGGHVRGYYIKNNPDHDATSGTHTKTGILVDNTIGTSMTGGTYTDYGIYSSMGGGSWIFPFTDTGVVYNHIGAYLRRSDIKVADFGGGTWEAFNTYGLKISGWGSATDTWTGANNSVDYAIHTDGGDVVFDNGHMVINGSTINPSYALDVEGRIECTSLDETSDERVKTFVMELPKSQVKRLCENLSIYIFRWHNYSYIYNITEHCYDMPFYNESSGEWENMTECIETKTIIGIDFGDVTDDYDVGIPAQHLYSYLLNFTDNPQWNQLLADGLVHVPDDESVELWNVNYRAISMIFARYTQILAEELEANNVMTGKLARWAMSLPEPYRFHPDDW